MRAGFLVGSLVAFAFVACVTNVENNAPAQNGPGSSSSSGGTSSSSSSGAVVGPDDSGSPALDAASSEGGASTSNLYVAICVVALAAKDPEQAYRFYAETVKTGDSLSVTLTPMVGWEGGVFVSPKTVSKSETRGDALKVSPATIGPDGKFTLNLGTLTIPDEANSVSGKTAVIENTLMKGVYASGDRFCSSFEGKQTTPYASTYEPGQNTCLFVRVADGAPLPKIPANQFVCN